MNNESLCTQSLHAWVHTHRNNPRGEKKKHTQTKKQWHNPPFSYIERQNHPYNKNKTLYNLNRKRGITYAMTNPRHSTLRWSPCTEDKTAREGYSGRAPCQENDRHYLCFFLSPLRETLGAICSCTWTSDREFWNAWNFSKLQLWNES